MKKLVSLALIVLGTTCAYAQANGEQHEWKAMLKVADEDGNPVAGSSAGVGYFGRDSAPAGIRGLTDTNGIFVATHQDTPGVLGFLMSFRAEKAGYYSAWMQRDLGPGYDPVKWNPTVALVLRKVGKPIPMYAKREETKVQKENEAVGFDLMAGDWVAPYGVGKSTDMLLTVHRKVVNDRQYEGQVKLTFPNRGDGIAVAPPVPDIGSAFKTWRTAAETGYETERTWHYSNSAGPEPVFGYFFRVRTVLDEDGNVKSALYGKVVGDIRFYIGTRAPRAGLGFDYYLNPTPNDRNVEFDPKRNLMRNLKPSEGVNQP